MKQLPASAAGAAGAVAAAAGVVASQSLVNIGKDCWYECGKKSGMCPFCGNGNACCRKDYEDAPTECQGALTFTTWHHECVVPVHSASTEMLEKLAAVGADAASLAAKKGMSPEDQAGKIHGGNQNHQVGIFQTKAR